jgi:hypothetical protein
MNDSTKSKFVPEEIKRRLISDNAHYHSVQNLLSSRLLPKNIKVIICKTTVLILVLYGCETWSLTVREEHKLRVFENRLLRRILGPKRNGVRRRWGQPNNTELHDFQFSNNKQKTNSVALSPRANYTD